MRYYVKFIKEEIYEVEAESKKEAEELAWDALENDPFSWLDPVDNVEITWKDCVS